MTSNLEHTTRMFGALQAAGITWNDAAELRRISMTLQRWHEGECGNSNDYGSWCIVRGYGESYRDAATRAGWSLWKCDNGTFDAIKGGEIAYQNLAAGSAWRTICERENIAAFEHDDAGDAYMERHHYQHGRGKDSVSYSKMPDREKGARKRLAAIMARYPGFAAYVQTDPRGASLYVLRPGDCRDCDQLRRAQRSCARLEACRAGFVLAWLKLSC